MNIDKHYDVVISGAGPTGLFLALRLHLLGFQSILILEKELSPHQHSKSLGLHPPSIHMIEQLGLFKEYDEKAARVDRGLAFIGKEKLGDLDFDGVHDQHSFIWIIPQWQNENILRQEVVNKRIIVLEGSSIRTVHSGSSEIEIEHNHQAQRIHYSTLVIAEGKNSKTRNLLGISLRGSAYPDRYVMADVQDDGRFEGEAIVNLHHEGLVESFPLPGHQRRWVCKIDVPPQEEPFDVVKRLVKDRMDIELQISEKSMQSSFGVEQRLAETLVLDNIFLAGDSAHIISPIGGQGMNLGWMDAWDLGIVIHGFLRNGKKLEELGQTYSETVIRRFREARFRAWFNMMMGRRSRFPFVKKLLVKAMLSPASSRFMAGRFSMYGLPRISD